MRKVLGVVVVLGLLTVAVAEEPGTSPTVPDSLGGNDPGLPYNNTTVPKTGPLT